MASTLADLMITYFIAYIKKNVVMVLINNRKLTASDF